MFHPTIVDPQTPHAVKTFVNRVFDLYLGDVHAMLRLPRPEVGITQACNFAISAVLMNVISGASVLLYEPPADRKDTRRKFKEAAEKFYPWDTEPAGAINDPAEGATILYETYRNPMAHAVGFHHDPEPSGPVIVSRFRGPGLEDAELEIIETSIDRPPGHVLWNAPTLKRNQATQSINLSVEPLYWGVRELLRRLTADSQRMATADQYLRPMLKGGA